MNKLNNFAIFMFEYLFFIFILTLGFDKNPLINTIYSLLVFLLINIMMQVILSFYTWNKLYFKKGN